MREGIRCPAVDVKALQYLSAGAQLWGDHPPSRDAAHALCEPYGESRSAAVKWLRAEPLEPEEVALLGLDTA